jgi:hypothetical protein
MKFKTTGHVFRRIFLQLETTADPSGMNTEQAGELCLLQKLETQKKPDIYIFYIVLSSKEV